MTLAIAQGIQATVAALRAVDPEIVAYHVDATDLYEAATPDLEDEARKRRDIVFLALDLVAGGWIAGTASHAWLLAHGADGATLERLASNAEPPDVIGLNLYPLFTSKRLERDRPGRLRIRMPYTETGLIQEVATRYHAAFRRAADDFRGRHVGFRSRGAWRGSRARWSRCAQLRADGVPVVGYTWWPMFALVTWAWRQGRRDVADHLLQMGLWDLDAGL